MGLHIRGKSINGMHFGGAAAQEARMNGAVVWPDAVPPADPWPTKPYLYLANGERMQVLEGTYDPTAQYLPGGQVRIRARESCSLLYPDTGSPGASLRYDFQSGASIVYSTGDAFRIYDRSGNLLDPIQTLPDRPSTYSLTLFYAYAGETLLMGLLYGTASNTAVNRRAASGVPGLGTTRSENTYSGITEEYFTKLHAIAMALTGGSQ